MATAGRNPPRPRASPSPLRLLLLLLGCCLLAAARKDKGAAGREAAPASGPKGGSSGRFVSPEQHACSWQLLVPAPGTPTGGELALRCQAPGGARLHCRPAEHPRPRARSRARPRQPVRSPSSPPEEKPSRAKTSAGGRKAGSDRVPEPPTVAELQPDGLDQNAELTETYCAEKWHSLCNFFVNFWNG
nr:fibroblast growth factor-binding protein 3 [Peromyscus maniculatus bairdii]